MCGIAGIVGLENAAPAPSVMAAMLRSMAHRGPDADDSWAEGSLVLGHRRLSILDLRPAGNQPMHREGRVIVYNGEIYNYLELRAQLEEVGCEFRTATDTEVILQAYATWGDECVSRFRGMWAFALYDGLRRRVLCSRDRFGIKPFYYARSDGYLVFASEIKALLAAGVRPRADMTTVAAYVVTGLEDFCDRTFYDGILQLAPGHNLIIDLPEASPRLERYYALKPSEPGSVAGDDYRRTLRDSVRLHLRSDVRVGTCLSGGVDSSVIAALAAASYSESGAAPFAAVTARVREPGLDETSWAKMVARHCSLEWLIVEPGEGEVREELSRCLAIHDEPVGSASVFLQYCVMRRAREAGVKVMLDGQGGDETMLGYERYYPAYFRDLARAGSWRVLGREFRLGRRNSRLRAGALAAYWAYFTIPAVRRQVLKVRSSFVAPDVRRLGLEALHDSVPTDLAELQIAEITRFQLPHLLRYEDRNSMAHSVEARVPFLDHVCVEVALGLPAEEKIRGGFTKRALRELAANVLPEAVAWRTDKVGFSAPDGLWLSWLAPDVREALATSRLLKRVCSTVPQAERLNVTQRWRLFNLATWERWHGVAA